MQLLAKLASGISLLSVLGLLGGCIPAPLGKYYKPIYSDAAGTYTGDQCQGQAGAPASLSFVIADGVSISVNTIRTYFEKDRKDRPLRISIGVPTGTQIQFLSREIRVSNSLQDQGKSISPDIDISAAVAIAGEEAVDFSKIAPTPFSVAGQNSSASDFSASTWLNFSWSDNFIPSAFSMEIPAIVLLDSMQADRLPLVLSAWAKKRLERYPGQYKSHTSLIYATKESESALAAEYAQCINSKSEAKCREVLLGDEAGFKLEKNGFKYSGRWYVFDVERQTPFSGEIRIEFDKPVRWKFASNKVRITDSSGTAEKIYQFDNFPLHFRYRVPINTPIRGVNNLANGKATMATINSSLGTEELPKYFVKMPPVLVNGKKYEFAPIELERRMFDFGMEPFNC